MELHDLIMEVWEIVLDNSVDHKTLHYLIHWYDFRRCPIEYLPFMFSYDFDW